MSWVTKQAGIDPLIKAARAEDWETVVDEVYKIVKKFAGADKADIFRRAVQFIGIGNGQEDGI